MGTWKQAYQLQAGDVVRASESREYEQPRTVQAVTTDHSDPYWGPRMNIAWTEGRLRFMNSYLGELSWVVLAADQ